MYRLIFFVALFAVAASAQDTVSLKGLKDKVTVHRDKYSRPYIKAANDSDLYFVQGYVTASDRLWQMDLMRRVARGRTAELFGARTLEEDKRWRRLGFAKVVDESIRHLTLELRAGLESYSAGVNAYIASLDKETLPVEFKILQYEPEPWTPADSLLIGKILADSLSTTWRTDLQKASLMASLPKEKYEELADVRNEYDVILFGKDVPGSARLNGTSLHKPPRKQGRYRDYPLYVPSQELLASAETLTSIRESSLSRIGLYAEDLAASNNWVISGDRTADGKPLLANDPHLAPTAPGIWYLSHLQTPTMRVAGVTFPGVPGIILGHNDHIAWGATNVGPDVQDLYLESFDSKLRVKTPKGWEHAEVRKEVINVRKSILAPATEPVELEVIETANGPIILEDNGKRYSLKWTARDPKNNDFGAFVLLNRAKNWNDFKAALATYRGATQNFVFADTRETSVGT